MPEFTTHVGLKLRFADEKVTLVGEITKLLYPLPGETYDAAVALSTYNTIKAHYEARQAAFDAAGTAEEKARREGEVSLENLTRKRGVTSQSR